MYVSIASRTGGRKYLSIVHGYRDENGKVRKKTILMRQGELHLLSHPPKFDRKI